MTGQRRLSTILLAVAGLALPVAGPGQEPPDHQKRGAVYTMYDEYRKEFPSVNDISPARAMKLSDEAAAVFVDVRTRAEIAVSKIPGAVTEEAFLKDPDRHAGRTVIVYCTIGYRSGMLAKKLAEKGIEMVNLKGGILAWTLEGGQVVDPDGRPVRRLHVYGEKWNHAPQGYETVTFGWRDRPLSQRPRQMPRVLHPLLQIVSPEAKLS